MALTPQETVFITQLKNEGKSKEEAAQALKEIRENNWHNIYIDQSIFLFGSISIVLVSYVLIGLLCMRKIRQKITKTNWYKKYWTQHEKHWWHRLFQVIWCVCSFFGIIAMTLGIIEGGLKSAYENFLGISAGFVLIFITYFIYLGFINIIKYIIVGKKGVSSK